MRTLSFSLFFCYFSHIFGHISGTTGPIGLKFCVRADFGHPVAHTKLQPLSLKDAEDIGWCVRNAGGALGFPMPVTFKRLAVGFAMLTFSLSGPGVETRVENEV